MTISSFNIYQQITSVRLASTTNLSGVYYNGQSNNGFNATLLASSVGTLILDGVQTIVGDRLFLKDQTNSNENGIYIVENVGSSTTKWLLKRASDFQSLEQLKVGQYFTVGAGNTLAGGVYVLTEPLPSTIGISNIDFIEVGMGGSGPFLTVAGNLSDVENTETSFSNLGLGSTLDSFLILTDSDFIGGIYQLTNPCPQNVTLLCDNPGNIIRLPSAQGLGAFAPSQGLTFRIAENKQQVEVEDFSTANLLTLDNPCCVTFKMDDNSTTTGTWNISFNVETFNNQSGVLNIPIVVESWDGSTTPVDVTAGTGIDITNGIISTTGGGGPVLSAFSSTLAGGLLNSTGDGTLVNVTCDNVVYNISGGYNNSTGIFTAPIDGLYSFGVSVFLSNLAASHTQYLFYLLVDGISYIMSQGNPSNERTSSNQLTRRGILNVQLTAGQTAQMQVEVSGGTKTVTIANGSQPTAFFGYLVGTSSGVSGITSLNGLTGILSLTSPESDFVITPSGSDIELVLSDVNVTPGTYGSSSNSSILTINDKGLVTVSSETPIQITESQVINLTTDLSSKLNLSGGTMTGDLILNSDPIVDLQASTKKYVDDSISGHTISLTGDVTGSGVSSISTTIANLSVTNSKIANSTIDLTTKVTGTLPQSNGGTGNTAYGANQLIFQNSGNTAFISSSALTYNNSTAQFKLQQNVPLNLLNTVSNLNTTTNSNAYSQCEVDPTGGDASFILSVSGATDWHIGVDNSDSDCLSIGNSFTVGSNQRLKISTSGVITVSNLTASLPIFTDSNKNLVSTGTVPIANGGTNQTTFPTPVSGARPIITFNGTSLTGSPNYTYNTTFDILKIESNLSAPQFSISTSVTGSGNAASIALIRGDQANGTATINYQTSSTTLWQIGLFPTEVNYFFTALVGAGGVGNVLSLGQTTGDITAISGNLIINTAGKTLKVKQGSNACFGTGAVLVAGTVTVNTTAVATGDTIFVSCTAAGGTQGIVRTSAIVNGTSFTLTSSSALDTSTYSWFIMKSA